jgi:hypothetical protein
VWPILEMTLERSEFSIPVFFINITIPFGELNAQAEQNNLIQP